jgi:polysaccharide pyruvyl transferase WcaK-like protein
MDAAAEPVPQDRPRPDPPVSPDVRTTAVPTALVDPIAEGERRPPPRNAAGPSSQRAAAPRVLLVGYNGANNTGAEALLLADIADMRRVFGEEVRLTVPTLDQAKLRRYLSETETVRIAPITPVFLAAIRRLVRDHDLVVLVEGHTYMDSWTSVLLWAFLWATHCAHRLGKPCLAYAVDAGTLRPFNRALTRRIASTTGLIVTRSRAAAERLRSWGVSAPIAVTADNAFTYQTRPEDDGWPHRAWPEAAPGSVGLALVDLFRWPVVVRAWGRREDCYRWPYYYTSSHERRRASEALAAGYAALVDELIERGKTVAFIAMEELDEPFAHDVQGRLAHPERSRVYSAAALDASQMTVLLRSLALLVTSRYHACVLSLAARVPQVAVGSDLRLETIYRELGLAEEYFLRCDVPGLFTLLQDRVERLMADPARQFTALDRGYREREAAARRNRALLRDFASGHGWAVSP